MIVKLQGGASDYMMFCHNFPENEVLAEVPAETTAIKVNRLRVGTQISRVIYPLFSAGDANQK